MCPQTAKDEIAALVQRGMDVELVRVDGQCYAIERRVKAPAPAWSPDTFDIMVAVPAAYDACSLDAFYVSTPYRFNDGEHPRVNGGTITYGGKSFKLVSWHYPDGKPWTRGQDDLASHLTHCKGFFLHRGP